MVYTVAKSLIKKILEHPLEHEWSIQGLGMLRLYLDERMRLHIWDDRYEVPNVSKMHTHPWDFESLVIAGFVRNQLFIEVPGEPTHFKQSIFCGEGGGLEGSPTRVRLEEHSHEGYMEGDSYSELAHEIHVSSPDRGTVTVVSRTFHEDVDHAFVYWEEGDWVSAEPRKATHDEILDITRYSLERWW